MPSTRDLAIDALTQQRMRYIAKDAYSVPLVFVLPVVFPVFGPLAMGWLLVRLCQWQLISFRHRDVLNEAMSPDRSTPENVVKFIRKFQKARTLICIGLIYWPIAMCGFYYWFFVRPQV